MDYNQFNLNPLRLQSLYENYGLPAPGGGMNPQMGGFEDPFSSAPTFESSSYSPNMVDEPLTPPKAPVAPTVESGRKPASNFFEIMDQRYTPETQATKRFDDLINNFPIEERPSLGRTLVSSAMGLGRGQIENSQKFLHTPYIRDVAAWKEQAGPAYNAANLERQSNANERQLVGQMAQYQVQSDKNQETADIARQRADTDKKYRDAQILKMQNPDFKFYNDGKYIMAEDPATGRVHNTGVESGNLSKVEELNLTSQNRIKEIETKGRIDEGMNTQDNLYSFLTQVLRGNQAIQTKQTPEGPKSSDIPSPSELATIEKNKYNTAWNSRPELRKWYVQNPNGTIGMAAPPQGGNFSGVSAEDQRGYDEARVAVGMSPYFAKPTSSAPTNGPAHGLSPRTIPVTPSTRNGGMAPMPSHGVSQTPQQPGQMAPQLQSQTPQQGRYDLSANSKNLPPLPPGTVRVTDQQGNHVAFIEATDGQIAAAKRDGYRVMVGQ